MEQKLDRLQRQTTAVNTGAAAKANANADAGRVERAIANAAVPAKGPVAPPEAIVENADQSSDHLYRRRPNCVAVTGRFHFDGGGYDYRPNTAATAPQRLNNGVNARRARIGVTGKFLSDWNFGLVYDFGGTSDGSGGTASAGGSTPVGFLPGGALSGLENAWLSYTGFKPLAASLRSRAA